MPLFIGVTLLISVVRHDLPRAPLECTRPRDFAREAHQVADHAVAQVCLAEQLLRSHQSGRR